LVGFFITVDVAGPEPNFETEFMSAEKFSSSRLVRIILEGYSSSSILENLGGWLKL
jgi:hypothetical protein